MLGFINYPVLTQTRHRAIFLRYPLKFVSASVRPLGKKRREVGRNLFCTVFVRAGMGGFADMGAPWLNRGLWVFCVFFPLSHFEFHFKKFGWPLGSIFNAFWSFGALLDTPRATFEPRARKGAKTEGQPHERAIPKRAHFQHFFRKKHGFFCLFRQRFFRPSFLSIFGRLGEP